jgi:hypothetical protein
MAKPDTLSVVHLAMNIGGMSWGLSRGERALGIDSDVLVTKTNFLDYPADRVIFDGNSRFQKTFRTPILIWEALKIRKKYDVFHFNFGSSLIDKWRKGKPLRDLPLFRNRGRIVVTYNGCDARQKYPTMQRVPFSACHDECCYGGTCNAKKSDELKRKHIEKFDHYADVIFAVNPDLFYFLPERTEFLPYAIANWDTIETVPCRPPSGTLRIVHAPTNRAAKGSDIIIDALQRARTKYGNRIQFDLIENMSNRKALEAYAAADLVIDQVLIGWYGGLAVEVMKMGKPVMAFIRDEDLRFLPKGMAAGCREAVIHACPDTIFDKLCRLIEDQTLLKEYRDAGLDYVHTWHSPTVVARITKAAYER